MATSEHPARVSGGWFGCQDVLMSLHCLFLPVFAGSKWHWSTTTSYGHTFIWLCDSRPCFPINKKLLVASTGSSSAIWCPVPTAHTRELEFNRVKENKVIFAVWMPTGWAPQNPFDVLFVFGILIFNWDLVLRKNCQYSPNSGVKNAKPKCWTCSFFSFKAQRLQWKGFKVFFSNSIKNECGFQICVSVERQELSFSFQPFHRTGRHKPIGKCSVLVV